MQENTDRQFKKFISKINEPNECITKHIETFKRPNRNSGD